MSTTTHFVLDKKEMYLELLTDCDLVVQALLMDKQSLYVLSLVVSGLTLTVLQVDFPEINAAWGQVVLLLHTVARKLEFTFET